jgi:plastocyanin
MSDMRKLRSLTLCCFGLIVATLVGFGCSGKTTENAPAPLKVEPKPSYFKVDPETASVVTGTIRFTGSKPPRKLVDMSEDPSCVKAHGTKAYDESLMVGPTGGVANAFVYIKAGLEGKNFEVPQEPVALDQNGCWFHPRVFGIQTGQALRVINSDPVTHNIHPMAEINREWNHSQGPGDAPLARKFLKPEVMIKVKCNIHNWMHAFIGVLDHPYFAVSQADGSFEIKNLPPGTYTLAVWQETLGTQEQQITVGPHATTATHFTFKGK